MEEIHKPPDATETRTKSARAWIKSAAVIKAANLVFAAVAIVLIFLKLQFATDAICCGDYDGYYHIKWAQMLWKSMRARHFPPAFTWLPLTTLDPRNYVDHHLLYHILLIPFTWFRDPQFGAKLSAVMFGSLAVFSCYWLIVHYRISYSLVWLLALLASAQPFLFRMNMTKAPPLTIVYLVVGIYLLFERKYWPLLPLAWIFALTYDMWVLLGLAAVFWTVAIGWSERRFEWRPLVWVAAGSALGLVINPYFPHNLYLFYEHARVKITAKDFTTSVGAEWYPYDTNQFVSYCALALVALLTGYIAFDGSDRPRSQRPLFLLIFSTILTLMATRWKRFAEYFPPFAVLFAAFTLQQYWLGRSVFSDLPDDVRADLQPFLDRQAPSDMVAEAKHQRSRRLVKASFVGVLLAAVLFANFWRTWKDIQAGNPRSYYAGGAAWMQANIPAGEIVFNTDWDDFPRLFYYDPAHVYVSGLDPTYLFDKSPDLSRLYDRITTGDEDDPGPLIRDRFGARWVFSDNTKDHDAFYDHALHSGWFDRVYEDEDCSVLHIRDQKSEPPPEENDNENDETGDQNHGPEGGESR